jgi:hypothetical protein
VIAPNSAQSLRNGGIVIPARGDKTIGFFKPRIDTLISSRSF